MVMPISRSLRLAERDCTRQKRLWLKISSEQTLRARSFVLSFASSLKFAKVRSALFSLSPASLFDSLPQLFVLVPEDRLR